MMKKIYLFSFALLFLISLAVAGEFGYNYLEDKNLFFGKVEFDGGWENGGCSITDGEIFCQVVNTINLTSVNITKENITITESITALGNFTVDSPTFHVDSINNLVEFPLTWFKSPSISNPLNQPLSHLIAELPIESVAVVSDTISPSTCSLKSGLIVPIPTRLFILST